MFVHPENIFQNACNRWEFSYSMSLRRPHFPIFHRPTSFQLSPSLVSSLCLHWPFGPLCLSRMRESLCSQEAPSVGILNFFFLTRTKAGAVWKYSGYSLSVTQAFIGCCYEQPHHSVSGYKCRWGPKRPDLITDKLEENNKMWGQKHTSSPNNITKSQ